MIRSIGTVILILLIIAAGKHDKKMKTGRKKVFDNVQHQMQEFSEVIKSTKIIKHKGVKK